MFPPFFSWASEVYCVTDLLCSCFVGWCADFFRFLTTHVSFYLLFSPLSGEYEGMFGMQCLLNLMIVQWNIQIHIFETKVAEKAKYKPLT